MAKDIETKIGEFVRDVEGIVGGGLRAIVLYGSGATGTHVPGRSDLNFLIVVDAITVPILDSIQKRMPSWAKERISSPFVVAPTFLTTSADSYPLEILGMMAGYRVLSGEDPFKEIRIAGADVRLQAEREAKAKALLLRRGYVESGGKTAVLTGYLSGLGPAVDAILRGLRYLRDEQVAPYSMGVREEVCLSMNLDAGVLEACDALRYGKQKPDRTQVGRLFVSAMQFMDRLATGIDKG